MLKVSILEAQRLSIAAYVSFFSCIWSGIVRAVRTRSGFVWYGAREVSGAVTATTASIAAAVAVVVVIVVVVVMVKETSCENGYEVHGLAVEFDNS